MKMQSGEECNTCIAGCSDKCNLPEYIIDDHSGKLECFCHGKCKDKKSGGVFKRVKGGKKR